MLDQAKNAKERLEAAGLKYRQDFTVRTERIVKPSQGFVGYGDAIISIKHQADAKAVRWIHVYDDGKAEYKLTDLTQNQQETTEQEPVIENEMLQVDAVYTSDVIAALKALGIVMTVLQLTGVIAAW